MSTVISGEYYTFAEAAKILGVTVARAHVLAQTYEVKTVPVNRMFKLIPKEELSKIPSKKERKRLSGHKMENRHG